MMYGGVFMIVFGMLGMLLMVGLPLVLIVLLVWGLTQKGNPVWQPPATRVAAPVTPVAAPASGRFCSHCGAGLQTGWTHCPQCGAPIE